MHPLKKQFIELYKLSGWKQAEVARRLDISRAAVNGIVTRDKEPSKALVRLFQFVLTAEKPELLTNRPAFSSSVMREGPPEPRATDEDIFALLTPLNGEDRQAFLNHMKGLAKLIAKHYRV